MKKLALIVCSILIVSLPASSQARKSKKDLQKENEELLRKIALLEEEVAAYKADAIDREFIEEELSGENENKVSAGVEELTPGNTDTLLTQWYMHRQSNIPGREQFDMDSVVFTTDVPDSVLMRRLEEMNSFITLPFNETVKKFMILYSEKMPAKMSEIMGLAQYYFPLIEETFRRYAIPLEL